MIFSYQSQFFIANKNKYPEVVEDILATELRKSKYTKHTE